MAIKKIFIPYNLFLFLRMKLAPLCFAKLRFTFAGQLLLTSNNP